MTKTTIDTHAALWSAIYNKTSRDVTFKTTPEGDTIFRNGHRFFAIGEEYDDDGETFWGWTWSTGIYETDGDGEIMEHWSTDGGQDALEPLAEAIRHLGAIEDNR